MGHPPLSIKQLQGLLEEAPASDTLYDILSLYEDEACQQFTSTRIIGDDKVLSAFYSVFLFSHLLIDEIQEARALTHRMPPTMINNNPVLKTSISALHSIWQNKYSETYEILRNQPWPSPLSIIVQRFDEYYSEKSFRNISRIYESIRPEVAAEYLGLEKLIQNTPGSQTSPELIDILVKKGWEWDAEKELFRPRISEQPLKAGRTTQRPNGISRIVGLANV